MVAWIRSVLDRSIGWAQRRPRLAAALGLALPVLLLYAPLLLGRRTFPDGDFTHHFLSFSLFQAEALRALRLPLWNPHTFGGHPFLADVQAAVFYPISNALLLLTLPLRDAAARLYLLQVEAVIQTLLAGWFVYLLVWEMVRVRWAALLAGLTFALSGYLLGYPPLQLAVLRTAIWLPLVLWLLLRPAQRARDGTAVGALDSLGLLWAAPALAVAWFAGHPQTFLYIAYTTVAWALLLLVLLARDRDARTAVIYAAGLLLTALLAVGIAAAQWLPSVEFTRLSVRAALTYAELSGGFPWRDLWQALLPRIFSQYSPLYVGVPALALAAAALVGVRRSARGSWRGAFTLFFAALAILALLASLGANGPLYPLLYAAAPGWDWFRGQERAAYLVTFALCVLAGLGGAALTALHSVTRRRLAAICAAALIAAAYAGGLLYQLRGATALSNGAYLAIALLTMLSAAAVGLALWLPGWSHRRSLLLLVLTVINLYAASYALNLDAGSPARKVLRAPEVAALQAAVAERAAANLGIPGRIYNEFRVDEDYAMRLPLDPPARVEDLWGTSPLRLARYATLTENFPLDRWWRLFGVEQLLTWRRELFVPTTLLGEFRQAADTTYLHRLTQANPRAWLATAVEPADDTRAVALLADHTFDLERTALLPPEAGMQAAALPTATAQITLTQPAPGRLGVAVSSSGPGLLLLAENWMPGWRLELEQGDATAGPVLGLPVFSVQRAELTLLGVPLPAGASRFTLVYDPASVRWGLWISAAALLLTALLLVFALRRRGQP